MPHVRCNGCGVVTWIPARLARSGGTPCPECGVPWPRRPDEVVQSENPSSRLSTLVTMTRDLLGVELALLTQIVDGCEVARVAAGEWPELGPLETASLPLEETYCRLMLEGRIANVVPDTEAHEELAELSLTRERGVRSYMGVPIEISDAELYVLCCLAREARPGIGTRELRLLSGLAESVRAELASLERDAA